VRGGAELPRPLLEQRRRIALAVGEPDRVQLASLAGLQHRSAEERLDPELHRVRVGPSGPHPEGAVVVGPTEEPGDEQRAGAVAQRGDQLAAELPVLRR
jgi:hypothetical protein